MQPHSVTCQVCAGDAHRVTWQTNTDRADYRCSECGAGGAITKQGRRVGPVLEGTTEAATEILQRRAHA